MEPGPAAPACGRATASKQRGRFPFDYVVTFERR